MKINIGKACLLSTMLVMAGGINAQDMKTSPFEVQLSHQSVIPISPSAGGGTDAPSVRVYLPDASKATGRAVIVCPGGGYARLAVNHEGYDWADFFNSRGIAVLVLKYSMPQADHKLPLSDAVEVLQMVRDSAQTWHINPDDVGIMGSSAGGHLAATVATKAPESLRPHSQILFYPVITMDKSYTHMGSHDNLLGKEASAELEVEYSNEKQADGKTPQAIIFCSDDDGAVPAMNSINYYRALHAAGVSATLHVYPTGGHGWGFRPTFTYHEQVLSELSQWLSNIK
jgi:acetyl esterase/lipase